MSISSRTQEGEPHACPICGEVALLEPSFPGGDSCCPACGQLLWRFRDRIKEIDPTLADQLILSASLREMGADSLEVVELVMELEEEFDLDIPDNVAERFTTIADLIRHLRRKQR